MSPSRKGLTAAQIALLLDRADGLTGDDPLPPEGAVMPSTYEFEHGATRSSIVERASAAMERNLAQMWATRAPGLAVPDAGGSPGAGQHRRARDRAAG